VRVLAVGFAPGQPYLGPLGEEWNLPRLKALQQVPAGALVQAISQFVLFSRTCSHRLATCGPDRVPLFSPCLNHV
jgi:5-oxoprolinase (ATP-hydrolysing) subunit B